MTIQTDLSNYLVGALKGYPYPTSTEILRTVYDLTLKALEPAPPTSEWSDDFSTPYQITKDGQFSPDKKWRCKFISGGAAGSDGKVFYLQPRKMSNGQTASALMLSTTDFKDFEVSFNMKTVKQLKDKPEDWEDTWFMWHYNDSIITNPDTGKQMEDKHHHYYFHIQKDGGVEVGRKDYDLIRGGLRTSDGKEWQIDQEQQQYLVTNKGSVKWLLNKSYAIILRVVGNNIKLWIDGILQCDLVDDGTIGKDDVGNRRPAPAPSAKVSTGKICMYVEDSIGNYDNFKVKVL